MGSHAALTPALSVLDVSLRQRDSINASIEEKMRSNNMELPQLVISKLGGGFKDVLFSPLLGEMIQFD